MSGFCRRGDGLEEHGEVDVGSMYGLEGLSLEDGDAAGGGASERALGLGVYGFESEEDEMLREISEGFGVESETEGTLAAETQGEADEGEDRLKTPKKRPFLRKGEGKSLVISNSRKANAGGGESLRRSSQRRTGEMHASVGRSPSSAPSRQRRSGVDRSVKTVDSLFLGTVRSSESMNDGVKRFEIFESEQEGGDGGCGEGLENLGCNQGDASVGRGVAAEEQKERDYDRLIQQKLDLLDEKMEYIHETHEDMMRKKTLLARERKLLESHKVTFEKELRAKFEKSKQEIESEKCRLERENNKLAKDKMALSDQVTRLKIAIKAKDAEISRLTREISQMEKEKERGGRQGRVLTGKREGLPKSGERLTERSRSKTRKGVELEDSGLAGGSSVTPLTANLQTTTSLSSGSSGSFVDRDTLVEEYLVRFDFEKELDLLYGILSTCFEYVGEGEDFMTLPGVPKEVGRPWCDIEKPYKVHTDEDLRTITFKFPSGLVEIVFYGEQEDAVCPRNTRKLLWTHLGWCILVYPNGDIKAVKPDKSITYHYVERDIVKCVVGVRDLQNYDGETSKLHLSKFFALGQLQCVDPETGKTYIIHSDMSRQIFNG